MDKFDLSAWPRDLELVETVSNALLRQLAINKEGGSSAEEVYIGLTTGDILKFTGRDSLSPELVQAYVDAFNHIRGLQVRLRTIGPWNIEVTASYNFMYPTQFTSIEALLQSSSK